MADYRPWLRPILASSVGLWVGLWANLALAEEPETAPAPPASSRIIDLHTPAPAPVVRRSYKVHDGFYLRGNVGLGSMVVDYTGAHGSSWGLASDLLIGGSPSPGFSLGGAYLMDTVLSADLGRVVGPRNVSIGLLGGFVDGFPNPKGGWHLGGAFGLATNSVSDLGSGTFVGFGGAGWAGYDAWVGDEWSVGGMLRVMATRTWNTRDGSSLDGSTRSLGFLITVLYN